MVQSVTHHVDAGFVWHVAEDFLEIGTRLLVAHDEKMGLRG
jgi:hypothetical protein